MGAAGPWCRAAWLARLREETHMGGAGRVQDQRPCGGWTDIAKGMHLTAWDLDKITGPDDAAVCADDELERAIQDVERFLIGGMAVGRWIGLGRHQSLNEAVPGRRVADEETQQDSCKVVRVGLRVGHGGTFPPEAPWLPAVYPMFRRFVFRPDDRLRASRPMTRRTGPSD